MQAAAALRSPTKPTRQPPPASVRCARLRPTTRRRTPSAPIQRPCCLLGELSPNPQVARDGAPAISILPGQGASPPRTTAAPPASAGPTAPDEKDYLDTVGWKAHLQPLPAAAAAPTPATAPDAPHGRQPAQHDESQPTPSVAPHPTPPFPAPAMCDSRQVRPGCQHCLQSGPDGWQGDHPRSRTDRPSTLPVPAAAREIGQYIRT